MIDVQIVVFDGFDELDAIGPYEVFDLAARFGVELDVELVTIEPTETVVANHGLRIEPDGTLTEPDVVVVPGGGWNLPESEALVSQPETEVSGDDDQAGAREQVAQGDLPEAIAALHDAGTTVASVCTGGMILAHAGVLDGRPAITHAGAIDDLRAFESVEVRDERVVDCGSVLTCGGVTSGLDLSLHLVERLADAETAARVAEEIEYDRQTV